MIDQMVNGARSVFRKRARSLLTVIGIAVGVMSVVVISTIGEIGKSAIVEEIDGIGMSGLTVRTVKSGSGLFGAELERIEAVDGVSAAMPLLLEYTESVMRGVQTDCAVWGIDSGAQNVVSMDLVCGRQINRVDVASNAAVCIVDESYAKKVYRRSDVVGKEIAISLGGAPRRFTVIGVIKTGGSIMQGLVGSYVPSFIFLPYTTLKSYTGKSNFNQVAVRLNEGSDPEQTARRIKSALSGLTENGEEIRVENLAAQRERLDRVLEIIGVTLSVIAGISLVVAGLSIMTVMLVSVSERKKEIGIKKSIGASGRKILFEFLTEAFLLSAAGSGCGVLFGLLFSWGGCALFGAPVLLDGRMIVFSVLFALGSGVLFGVYPAVQAAKLRPADALRSEV